MLLYDLALKLQKDDVVTEGSVLSGSLLIQQISEQMLAQLEETIYVKDEAGRITRKVSKSLLKYLLSQQQKLLYLAMLNSVREGIIAVDASGRIFYMNQAYTDIVGVKPYKIMGKYLQKVEPNSLLEQVLKTRQPAESKEQRVPSLNRFVALYARPLFIDREFSGAISIFRDVTEVHSLNEKVEKMSGMVDEYALRLQKLSTVHNLGITTQDRTYLSLLEQAAVIAQTDVPVLICGENGVGKEGLVHYIHKCSTRNDASLVTVNCAAIPEELLESELFGYEEGTFTGAVKGGRKGKFELANHGTIFLDEIGDMPVSMQAKLLRVIQQGEIEKVGRQQNVRVDVRILAATNQPLEQMIVEKRFRQDLFYRLNAFTLHIPPLRERPDDIILLTNYFLKQFNQKYHKNLKLSSEAYNYLLHLSWPGNVRELQNDIERAVILEDEKTLFSSNPQQSITSVNKAQHMTGTLKAILWNSEEHALRQALENSHGNRSQAIEILGLSERTFYRKCRDHHLRIDDFSSE